MKADIIAASAAWDGPGAPDRRTAFSWQDLVWRLVFPRRRHRIALTVPGVFLMVLALGIGSAAYNTASNILFITLSLLLACLLLSGLLSWFNLMGTAWRIRPLGPWRANHDALVTVEVRNEKRWLPTYSLWFELATQPARIPEPDSPEHPMKIRELLKAAEKHITRGRVFLRDRVEPGGLATLEWGVKPTRRGPAKVELASVASLFPFGFLRKNLGTDLQQAVLVWPAQVEYHWTGPGSAHSGSQGRRMARQGTGDDLLALRRYQQGDSHRLIHWKASARLGQLMIRQFAAESHDGFVVTFDTTASLWPRPEQFELGCSLAGTLAEDLFASGRLRGAVLPDGEFIETRRLRDVEGWLDALARAEPATPATARGGSRPAGKNLITIVPDGARGVAAYVEGHQVASA